MLGIAPLSELPLSDIGGGPASPDITLALSGQAVTCSAGTLGVGTSVALSGQAATVSAGTLTPSFGIALSGQALTASAGTLGVSTSLALSGQAATASAGTLGVSTSIVLAGSEATASAGVLVPELSLALLGQEVAASAGTIGAEIQEGQSVGASGGRWQFVRRRRRRFELPEEVEEAAEQVAEVAEQVLADVEDESALITALDALAAEMRQAVQRNKAVVERAAYQQLMAAVEAEQMRLQALEMARLEAHLEQRKRIKQQIDAEAAELLELLSVLDRI